MLAIDALEYERGFGLRKKLGFMIGEDLLTVFSAPPICSFLSRCDSFGVMAQQLLPATKCLEPEFVGAKLLHFANEQVFPLGIAVNMPSANAVAPNAKLKIIFPLNNKTEFKSLIRGNPKVYEPLRRI